MEYKVIHLKEEGQAEPCGIIKIDGQSFDFVTEKPELAALLRKVKQQGYVERIHDLQPVKVRPDDSDFKMALEEYLGNYRIRKSQQ